MQQLQPSQPNFEYRVGRPISGKSKLNIGVIFFFGKYRLAVKMREPWLLLPLRTHAEKITDQSEFIRKKNQKFACHRS